MFEEITAPLITTEWGRRAGLLLLIILSISLIVTVLQAPWTWHADYILAHRTYYSPAAALDFADQTTAYIMRIPQRHLLGHPKAYSHTVIPITSLQLRLIGVVQSTSKSASRVIISEAGQTGKVYQIGDVLSSGVNISGTTMDGVILDNGGHLEKLPLQRTPLIFQARSKKSL
jgi:type II secretory pathway component PulC